jgi:hypothetical protein
MAPSKVDAFWRAHTLQSCVNGRCVDGRCVCTAMYSGDTCNHPLHVRVTSSNLARWARNLPYTGQAGAFTRPLLGST